jgi:hypothetical protein
MYEPLSYSAPLVALDPPYYRTVLLTRKSGAHIQCC